jgi:nucleotide-binding universal stress UspA family protein
MFKTIIVGVDGHEGGRDALALADRLAQSFGGEIVAVHAYPYDYFVGRGADREFEAAMRQGAMETLETELSHAGVAAHPVVVSDDSPGRALHRTAELEDGDLIVVGSAHRGRIGRVLAGDHATGALHGAPCAVLVAPRGYAARGAKLETIGVGFDGSPEARAALAVARAIAEAAGARMRVIEVVAPTEPGGPFAGYQRDWVEHARIKREDAEERLAAILSELGASPRATLPSAIPHASSPTRPTTSTCWSPARAATARSGGSCSAARRTSSSTKRPAPCSC